MDKKGFLFTVTVFLILIYILLSISVWVKSVEASERSYSEFYKESTVELTMEQITPDKMGQVSDIILNRGLARLNDHAAGHSVDPGPPGDEFKNVREAMAGLLMNGSADPGLFKGGVGISEEENSSLQAWKDNLNASLRAIGVYVSDFEASGFQLSQNDIDQVNYSYDLRLGLRDYTNTSAVSRLYRIEGNLSIAGLVDPALMRESRDEAGDNQTVYRQFFFEKDIYPDHSSISVSKLGPDVEGGQGWIYGPLAMAGPSEDLAPTATAIAPSLRKNYVLVGTYGEIEALQPAIYEAFAGYILTDEAVLTLSDCGDGDEEYNEADTLNPIRYIGEGCNATIDPDDGIYTVKPFAVAPDFEPDDAPVCPLLDGSGQERRCVLLLNTYLADEVAESPSRKLSTGSSGLFEVEAIRDFVMCGYYTHNPSAPSYLQRLLNGSYSRNSSAYGIETFVIGIYANDYGVYDTNSRLDRELFSEGIDGVKVRGMPGCKDFSSCADSPVTGIFAVSEESRDDYGLDGIACDNGAAGCD